ncbi:MAG TPA: helix-turn-helix domain-containing protein [Solirubrobacteraceae bacterium]|jgi:AcrR family transcriptional regulator|nr:helix-turn-helix domain-containing protein [Solirubrobacteraceae bacterium]
MTTGPTRPLRKDKERSRQAIIAAARELFGSGRQVPMYEIARHAGVGQATLYRHFSDRAELVATICHEHTERIEAAASLYAGDPDGLWRVLGVAVDLFIINHDFLSVLRETENAPLLYEIRARIQRALAGPLRLAIGAGSAPSSLTSEDLLLALQMINGALEGIASPEQRTAVAYRALELLSSGLRR